MSDSSICGEADLVDESATAMSWPELLARDGPPAGLIISRPANSVLPVRKAAGNLDDWLPMVLPSSRVSRSCAARMLAGTGMVQGFLVSVGA